MKNLHVAAFCAAAVALASCTVSEDRATSIIRSHGYTNIELGGPSIFGCSQDDTLTRTFKATAQNGARVSGSICSGLLKGATVRIDRVGI